MNVQIEERAPVTVAGLRYTGPYGDNIAPFWRQTVYAWLLQEGLLGRARYGISLDDPRVTAPAQCRYDATVEVAPDYVPGPGVHKTELPGGLYAVYRFQGTPAQLGEAWHQLMADWLPASGWRLDARLPYEYVPADARHDPETGVFECRICIPVTH